MTCQAKTEINFEYGVAVKISDSETGISFYMPSVQHFEDIRWHIKKGSRFIDAYDTVYRAEYLPQFVPPTEYVPCIKAIYTQIVFDPNLRIWVDRPAGDWIYQEACNCLVGATKEGRIDLGDGFIVPNYDEQTRINSLVFASNYDLYSAIQGICPDITPPLESIACIEQAMRGTNWHYYDIYTACRAVYVAAQASLPGTSPPPEPKNNTLLYVVGGLIVFLVLSSR